MNEQVNNMTDIIPDDSGEEATLLKSFEKKGKNVIIENIDIN